MCNFWKHQGFCLRGDSCTYAHGEADKRPQYTGTDVRRKNPPPSHFQQQGQPQEAVKPAADPAELMRQVAAASGRAAAGASSVIRRPRLLEQPAWSCHYQLACLHQSELCVCSELTLAFAQAGAYAHCYTTNRW
jgi:hypothetical protein